jgi:small conductance mechanosensitive channel
MKSLFVWLALALLICPVPVVAQEKQSAGEQEAVDEGKGTSSKEGEEASGSGDTEEDPQAKVENAVNQAGKEVKETAVDAVEAVKSGEVKEAAKKVGELLMKIAFPAGLALVIMIVAYFIAATLSRMASKPVRKKVDETLGRFVGKIIFYVIMLGALLGLLQYFGIGVTSFAAILGAAGFAVGLAFQGSLSNFSAGIMLLVFRPFKVGDVINAAGITAKVYEISLFSTVFDTPDNRRIIVPNSMISGGTIENITHHDERRVDITVGVDYSANIDRTREVLLQAAQSIGGNLEGDGRGIQVALTGLGASSVDWAIRIWYSASDFWPKREELLRAVKNHLDQAGIGIPYPQMDVHLVRSSEDES